MTNSNFIGSKISALHFTFAPMSREYISEASDLRGYNFDSRIYATEADRGFRMAIQEREVDFILIDTKRDAEGDLQYWEFRPSHADLAFNPDLIGVRAVIHND